MELLDVYPVEDTIIGRANKISLALGTRSPIQVRGLDVLLLLLLLVRVSAP